MKVSEFEETFNDAGIDIRTLLHLEFKELTLEVSYFNRRGFVRIPLFRDGHLREICIYSKLDDKESSKKLFKQHLNHLENREIWFKKGFPNFLSIQDSLVSSVFSCEDYSFVVFSVLQEEVECNSFSSLEEAAQFIKDFYAL